MSVPLNYPDTITLVSITINEYATPVVDEQDDVSCIFVNNTNFANSNHQAAIGSDAVAYIDPCSDFVKDNHYRLEEMMVIANPLGGAVANSWYQIIGVDIGIDSQLSNQIDNITLSLKKTSSVDVS